MKWKPDWYYHSEYSSTIVGAERNLIAPVCTTPRKWIVDSGSCFDLINRNELSAANARSMHPTVPIHMQTANGTVTAHHELSVVIDKFDTDIHAIVMDDAPTVLSLGKRCMADGYEFHWKPDQSQY